MDIAEPLVSILKVMYEGREDWDHVEAGLIEAVSFTRKEQHSQSPDHGILQYLLHLTENENPLTGNQRSLRHSSPTLN